MPEPPAADWFAGGIIDRRKFDEYLLSPDHRQGRHKQRLWQSVFGIGPGEGELLEQLIRDHVRRGVVVEKPPRVDSRRFEVKISNFEGPAGAGPVLTAWAAEHGAQRPHLVTAFPIVR